MTPTTAHVSPFLLAVMVLIHIGSTFVIVVDSSFISQSSTTRIQRNSCKTCCVATLLGASRRRHTTTTSLEAVSKSLSSSSFDSSQDSATRSPLIDSEATSKVVTTRMPPKRINPNVRQLMRLVQDTFHDMDGMDVDSSQEWKKMKTYFYHNSATLTMIQVQKVLSSLLNAFSPDLVRHIVQSTPRILKRNVKTQLQPTIDFLQNLYGPSLLQQALQRKPDLLLLRGMGYYPSDAASAAGLDLIEVLLRHELKFTSSDIQKLQQTAPSLFQIPMVHVLSNIAYFQEILRAGAKSTLAYLSTSDNDDGDDKNNGNDEKMNQVIRKLILSHPSLLYLSLESNLKPRMEFLKEQCHFDTSDLAFLLSGSSAGILGLSITDNLAPTIHFLEGILGLQRREGGGGHDEAEAANDDNSLRKCLRAHPQLLGLSLKNLQSKVSYFNAIDNISNTNKPRLGAKSLASRILLRSPAVYSLSLNDNIIPTVNFLAKIWGVHGPNAKVVDGDCVVLDNVQKSTSLSSPANSSLSSFLSEYPSILTLSLEGNLFPTVNFFNRTGYISLDADWNRVPEPTTASTTTKIRSSAPPPSPPLRGRYLAASLFNRLLPRWHYCITRENKEQESLQKVEPLITATVGMIDASATQPVSTSRTQSVKGKTVFVQGQRRKRRHGGPTIIPLHVLVCASDTAFCETMDIDETAYLVFKKDAVPRLKFSSQFDTWLKTGRAIEV